MNQALGKSARGAQQPEPTWDIAYLFPAQGQWSEDEYLALDTNWLVELSDGVLEVLPMPTTSHQMLAAYLYRLLAAFSSAADLGTVLFAPLPVRLWRRKFREPDVVFMLKDNASRIGEQYWDRADLIMEVVSPGAENRQRDLDKKRQDYARAKIPEYWIVDPEEERITVLRLAGKRYAVHGEFPKGTTATSHLLPGFAVDVSAALSQRLRRARTARQPRRKRPQGEA